MATFKEAAEQLGLSLSATMRRAHLVKVVTYDDSGGALVNVDELNRRWEERRGEIRRKGWEKAPLSVEIRRDQRDRIDEIAAGGSVAAVVRDLLDEALASHG